MSYFQPELLLSCFSLELAQSSDQHNLLYNFLELDLARHPISKKINRFLKSYLCLVDMIQNGLIYSWATFENKHVKYNHPLNVPKIGEVSL